MKTSLLCRILLIGFCVLSPIQILSAKESLPLSDEEFSQEVKRFVVKPCAKRALEYVKKSNPFNTFAADLTIDEFLRLAEMNRDLSKAFKEMQQHMEKEILDDFKNVKHTSKDNRNLIYKMAKSGCEQGVQEQERNEGLSKTNRQTLREDSLKSDSVLNNSSDSDSVPAHIRKKAMEHCKQQYELLDSFTGGGFGSSWSMLNLCVEQEIRSYEALQQNYGN